MKVIVLNSAAQVGEEVGKIFCDEVNAKHNAVLGLATGASPIPTYEYMTEQYRSGKVSSPQQLLFVYGREPFLEGRYKARKCQFP